MVSRESVLASFHWPCVAFTLVLASSIAGCGGNPSATDAGVPGSDATIDGTPSNCGNRVIESGEDCDDGNLDDADGCTAQCKSRQTIGCSDGRREGFPDLASYPDIAGCSGVWSRPGVLAPRAQCVGQGDDGASKTNCAAADLCASGWHICLGFPEVMERTASKGCTEVVATGDMTPLFFTTQQNSVGAGSCDLGGNPSGANDLFGCGTIGILPNPNCAPLDKTSADICRELGPPPWFCPGDPTNPAMSPNELTTVVKSQSARGGVMCCRDKAP